jgi:hypothetical protein
MPKEILLNIIKMKVHEKNSTHHHQYDTLLIKSHSIIAQHLQR